MPILHLIVSFVNNKIPGGTGILQRLQRLLLAIFCFGVCVSVAEAENHVLSLDSDGDYVRLPPDIFHYRDEVGGSSRIVIRIFCQ
ncbi:hypothetical protein IH992_13930 [Candidatus Poribacteria bacterium]|nr:hypothetical protein [Candidatus Poribacteria bacterium]